MARDEVNFFLERLPYEESHPIVCFFHSQEESEEPEYMFPKDMRNFRPLVKKCQSLGSLMREQLAPLPRIEEKKSKRHVTRTQSVPAQSRPKRERRTRADANSVADKDQEDTTNTVKVTKIIMS